MLLTMFCFIKRNISRKELALTSRLKSGELLKLCIHQFPLKKLIRRQFFSTCSVIYIMPTQDMSHIKVNFKANIVILY